MFLVIIVRFCFQVLQALDDACKIEEMKFIYLQALRDNFFVPWVKGSRLADFRGYTFPVAKVALLNILQLMKDGKLALFNLHIAVCDATQVEVWTYPEVSLSVQYLIQITSVELHSFLHSLLLELWY